MTLKTGGGGGGAEGLIGYDQGVWLMPQSIAFQNWVYSIGQSWEVVWHTITFK